MVSHTDGCDEFRALASSRLDGELTELDSLRLERHFGVCADCETWMRDAAALATMLRESISVPPAWSSVGLVRSLRWRFVHATSVGAAAASAAAVAIFVAAQPGNGLSLYASGGALPVSPPPCVSCMKMRTLAFAAGIRQAPAREIASPYQRHVTNPLVEP